MDNCRFCEIINSEFLNEELVYQNKNFIVLIDKFRRTSVGAICLVIPKKHRENLLDLNDDESQELLSVEQLVSRAIQEAFQCNGIRIWTAINKEAGQSIFHCHIHILGCNSFIDRLIANFPGIYDLINFRRKLSKKERSKLAEQLRNVLPQTERNSTKQ